MLPKKERLTRAEFNRFFGLGRRKHSPSFQVVYYPYEALHVSVVVSKKIAKTAVLRNKIRRRIYDIVRLYRKEFGLTGVYIFLAKAEAIPMKYDALKSAITTFLNKK